MPAEQLLVIVALVGVAVVVFVVNDLSKRSLVRQAEKRGRMPNDKWRFNKTFWTGH